MPEVKLMVAEDPSMLEGFSKEEEKEMVKAILTKRERKTRGTRANNLAAAADAKRTMDRLMIEVGSLRSWRRILLTLTADNEFGGTRGDDRFCYVLARPRPR
jgi:hypothetical protein